LNIDTGAKFKEIYEFRDRLAGEWGLDLRVERNEEALKTIRIAANKAECCHLLKTAVIVSSIQKYRWQYVKTHDVPYCVLYRKGYRGLGCEPCTKRGAGPGTERAGRDQSKEEIMNRLRRMGYF
jgi:phosphoadenosine phosphosulfate reductase